jgi:hypothetical protein
MERMLQYVWKHKLYAESDFITTDGVPVFVIDPGISNHDAGPDFFNAKIRIGDTIWVGNVEIHECASDWLRHRHHKDKLYDTVILHVVRLNDAVVRRTDDEPVPQVVLSVPEKIEKNIEWLLSRDRPAPCTERIGSVSSLYLSDWMGALLTERLERKTDDIFIRLEKYSKDWNEMFYVTLIRNFGFGTNSDAFESLAGSLPYKFILKHRNNPLQVEALFFGQAGLLDPDTDVADKGAVESADSYLQSLRREYDFLRKKYRLQPVDAFLFKKLRIRPVNFPHIRIAQIASVWIKNDLLFSKALETDHLGDLRMFFNVEPSGYWTNHYHFRSVSASKRKSVGKNASDIILINTVIPVLFAYGKYKNLPEYCERALGFLEEIAPERNSIVTVFNNAGISVRNAGETQALIQLRREYCDKKKCLYCRIGFRVIGDR